MNMDVSEDILMVHKGNLSRNDDTDSTANIQKVHNCRSKGNKYILYVKLQKVLYGLMKASLLFYRKPRKQFEE